LLAMDEEEARTVAEDYLKEKPLIELYDSVLIPALAMAEQDRHENQLDDEREKFIYETTKELIEELGEEQAVQPQNADVLPSTGPGLSVLCIPVRGEADELGGLMLAQILRMSGHHVDAIAIGFVEEMLAKVTEAQPDVLCISALPPFAIGHARSLCRKARQSCPDLTVVVGLWGSQADPKAVQRRLGSGCSEYVVHTLAEARLQLKLFTDEVQTPVNQARDGQAEVTAESREPQVVERA
jgi:CheY-like chemotaxis protein